MKPTLTITKDLTENFNRNLKALKPNLVLVGIPTSDTTREKASGSTSGEVPVTNASILALNEFGSPANNIPARPVMAIGIRNAKDDIAAQFEKAAVAVLEEGKSGASTYLNRAGSVASNSVKKAINDQDGIAGPSEATLAARKAQGFKGEKALIVTGQLRNAITWVLTGDDATGGDT